MPLSSLLKRAATFLGRAVEFAFTGQSDFHLVTSELRDFDHVTDLGKGQRLLEEARRLLEREFQIRLTAPVILELGDPSQLARAPGGGIRDCPHHAALGWYRPHPLGEAGTAHTIFVQKGLARARFKALVAHELVHAWERENGVLAGERALREGFARWVEYKVLIREGDATGARRLAQLRHWRFGRGIRTLLAIEKERGADGVLEFVRHRK